MDTNLVTLAKERLNELGRSFKADNWTCYFYNTLSDVYWLFHAEGRSRYPHLVSGPIVHPAHTERFTADTEPAEWWHVLYVGNAYGKEFPDWMKSRTSVDIALKRKLGSMLVGDIPVRGAPAGQAQEAVHDALWKSILKEIVDSAMFLIKPEAALQCRRAKPNDGGSFVNTWDSRQKPEYRETLLILKTRGEAHGSSTSA
jgi:hypothetical protein